MSSTAASEKPLYVRYPESDGKPLAENTRQWRWIYSIAGGLDAAFAARPDVFVAGNLLWYPVEGRPDIRIAPDALVAFGRPKGDRGSYLQWLEGNIAPQVVFEVLSPGNRHAEMVRKFKFYEQHGVEEYYLYDPDTNELEGWRREGGELVAIEPIDGWVSPRLNIRFVVGVEELELYRTDGRRLPGYAEMTFGREQLLADAEQARRQLAEERALLEQARARAEQEQARAEQEQARAEQEQARAERLAARLRAMGVDPDADT
jgi:Uma2 family endonuclease